MGSYSSIILLSIIGKVFMLVVILFYVNINSKFTLVSGFMSIFLASFFMLNQANIINSLTETNESLESKSIEVLIVFFFIYAISFILLIIKKIKSNKKTLLLYVGILIALISMA